MAERRSGRRISRELDDLSCELMGSAFDRLADGLPVNVLLAVADARGNVASFEFADDGAEACLAGAYNKARSLARSRGDVTLELDDPCYYALCYEGAVADEDGSYADALIMEFGERGQQAYSAYSLFEGRGAGDGFAWTDPAPAGEVDNLL